MTELINLRLSRYAAQSYWRSSTATHFGGINGTMTFDKDACQALADSGRCPQSPPQRELVRRSLVAACTQHTQRSAPRGRHGVKVNKRRAARASPPCASGPFPLHICALLFPSARTEPAGW